MSWLIVLAVSNLPTIIYLLIASAITTGGTTNTRRKEYLIVYTPRFTLGE